MEVNLKTKIISGNDALKSLSVYEKTSVFIVCDKFLVENGMVKEILRCLDPSNQITIFSNVIPDPPIEIVAEGYAMMEECKPAVMIAFGGGSAIDTAKGLLSYAFYKGTREGVKFIAIPTTSGTGSEVTAVTVITDHGLKTKHLFKHPCMVADEAILDARLALTVPPAVTAFTGMDVLTHAIEAYVAKAASSFTDALAEKAVEMVISALLTCYKQGDDLAARTVMHEASTLAGVAFTHAGLGINHSLAHKIGGCFHVPHGLANTILLNAVIDFISGKDAKAKAKYAALAKKTGLADHCNDDDCAVKALQGFIDKMKKDMNMIASLSEYGISREDFLAEKESLAVKAFGDACTEMGPTEVTPKELERILEVVY